MVFPFLPPYNSLSLVRFRASLPALTRKFLTTICEYRIENNSWMSVREFHRTCSDPKAEEVLENLGPTIISKNESTNCYNFTILAVLLAERGEEDEEILVRYLKYLKERDERELEFKFVLAGELITDWNISQNKAFRVSCLVGLIRFCDRSTSTLSFNNWSLSVPRFMHQFLQIQSMLDFIRLSALDVSFFESGYTQDFTIDVRNLKTTLANFSNRKLNSENVDSKFESSAVKTSGIENGFQNYFIQKNEKWYIQFKGVKCDFSSMNGLSHIANLLGHPDTGIPCKDLKSVLPPNANRNPRGIILNPTEQDRKRVERAMTRAYTALKKKIPELEKYLRQTIVLGANCQYTPKEGFSWQLSQN